MEQWGVSGDRILLPRASIAREILPLELVNMGATVDEVPAYQTVKPDHDLVRVREMLKEGKIHMITFTSSSTVTNFAEMLEAEGQQLLEWMRHVEVACIGPITAKTAQEKGFSVSVIPSEYTIESLSSAIVQFFSSLRS